MGHGDPNAGNPTLHSIPGPNGEPIYRIELSVGMELGFGHVATSPAEFLSEAQWYACLAAAPQGWAALAQALQATPAATWLDRVVTKSTMHGVWPATRALLLKRFTQCAPLNTRAALDAHRWLLEA